MYVPRGIGDYTPDQILATLPGNGQPCPARGTNQGWPQGCADPGPNQPDDFNLICTQYYGNNCITKAPSWETPESEWPSPQPPGVFAAVPCTYSAFGSAPCNPASAPVVVLDSPALPVSSSAAGAAAVPSVSGMSTGMMLLLAAAACAVYLMVN